MTWRDLDLFTAKPRLYRAPMGRMLRRVTGLGLACAALLPAPSPADAAPTGSVSGWRSPASGELELAVWAKPDGADLRSASARLGSVQYPAVAFADGSCQTECPAKVTLRIDTEDVADGFHQLVVTVEDVDGVVTTIDTVPLEVDNTPPVYTSTVTISVSSGAISPSPPPPGGGVTPGATAGCASPRLSMFLAQAPLRARRGVPVLQAGKRYRFRGELTCRINGRRRAARPGTPVALRIRVGGRVVQRQTLKVRKDRRLVLKLAFPAGRRVLVFSVRGTGGDTVSVRVPVRVVKVKKRGRR